MTTRRRFKQLALLAKMETTVGTDSVPSASANAILAQNVEFTPVRAAQQDTRNLYTQYMGNQGQLRALFYGQLSFDVEAVGSGTAGTAPKWGPLMRGCGMSELVTTLGGGDAVKYAPISKLFEALSIYFYMDGVRWKMVGNRGNFEVNFRSGEIPRFRFTFMGLCSGGATDTALPSPSLGAFRVPVICNDANTVFAYNAVQFPMFEVKADLGAKVEPYTPVGKTEMVISDRQASGSMSVEDGLVADQDFDDDFKTSTRRVLTVTHGVTAGDKVKLVVNNCQVRERSISEEKGFVRTTVPFDACIVAGNDEIEIWAF